MRNSLLISLLAFHDIYGESGFVKRKTQPTQSTDEMLKLINKAEAKRQRKNKARLAREAGNKNG